MSTLTNGTNLTGTITLSKKTGTTVSLDTDKKYLEKDIVLTLNVEGGSATTPATTITANPSISVDSSGLITATTSKTQNVTPTVSAGWVGSGTAGTITVSGSNTSQLTSLAATTYNTSTVNQTIAKGKYLTGAQTIRAVTTSNLSAANIKAGVTVKVGDSADDDRIAGVAGTFTDSTTVSSGQTAATAAKILNGYSAWVNGSEVKGSIATKNSGNITVNGKTVTVPIGYYSTQVSVDVTSGNVVLNNPTVNANGLITAGATVTAGYVDAATPSKTLQLTSKAATTYNTSTTNQTIASGQYLTGAQTIRAVSVTNLSAANIKAGVTIKVGDSADDDRIAGVAGTFTNDATAAAGDILSAKTAYVNGSKVTGTILTKSAANLTANGATVTVPSGYYPTQATKDVSSGSAFTPAVTIVQNPTITVNANGLVTATYAGSSSIIPTVTAGYIAAGTTGTVSTSGTKTYQLTSKAAATITPGTTNQTIAAGTYLTGAQTIAGDANLVAGNIVSGVTIFGVSGTYYVADATGVEF